MKVPTIFENIFSKFGPLIGHQLRPNRSMLYFEVAAPNPYKASKQNNICEIWLKEPIKQLWNSLKMSADQHYGSAYCKGFRRLWVPPESPARCYGAGYRQASFDLRDQYSLHVFLEFPFLGLDPHILEFRLVRSSTLFNIGSVIKSTQKWTLSNCSIFSVVVWQESAVSGRWGHDLRAQGLIHSSLGF